MGAATLLVLAIVIPPLLLTVAGGLLILGQGRVRGRRFWTGMTLMAIGGTLFVGTQIAFLAF